MKYGPVAGSNEYTTPILVERIYYDSRTFLSIPVRKSCGAKMRKNIPYDKSVGICNQTKFKVREKNMCYISDVAVSADKNLIAKEDKKTSTIKKLYKLTYKECGIEI